MPIYEYKCQKCGKEYELFQNIAEPAQKSCKFCKGTVKKLVSLSSFQLNGSGWYVTDYGGKKPCAPPEGGKKEEAAPSATMESCSEGSACKACPKNS